MQIHNKSIHIQSLVAPLKKKVIKHRKSAPWYNSETRNLKQKMQKLERKWRLDKLVESRLVWKESLKIYRKALRNARGAYYSSLIEKHKSNPRFLYSAVARLTESHSSIEPCIPIALSGNDFMTFFYDNILIIRGKINHLWPSTGTNLYL